MLEYSNVLITITMVDEVTGKRMSTQYSLNHAIFSALGASNYHINKIEYVYGKLDKVVESEIMAYKGEKS